MPGPPRVPRTPIGDFILVRPFEARTQVGGMDIPETQYERPRSGVVILCGPGKVTENGIRIPLEVFPGDVVHFAGYAGKDLDLQLPGDEVPQNYLIVRHDELYFNDGPERNPSPHVETSDL